jgi:hypothetical protein
MKLFCYILCSLLVSRKVADFCKLVLYLASMLKLIMVSRSFWWHSLDL